MVRGEISGSVKSQELHFEPAKICLRKKAGKSEILIVHMFFFARLFLLFITFKILFTFYGHESCCNGRILFMKLNDKLMFGISRKFQNQVKPVDLILSKGHVERFHVTSQ